MNSFANYDIVFKISESMLQQMHWFIEVHLCWKWWKFENVDSCTCIIWCLWHSNQGWNLYYSLLQTVMHIASCDWTMKSWSISLWLENLAWFDFLKRCYGFDQAQCTIFFQFSLLIIMLPNCSSKSLVQICWDKAWIVTAQSYSMPPSPYQCHYYYHHIK